MDCTIRPFQEGDFSNGFFETLSALRPTAMSLERAKEILSIIRMNPFHHIFVAVVDGMVVGTITCLVEQKFIHDGGRVPHIEDVAVHKDYQGKGIFRRLTDYVEDFGIEMDCYKAILNCDEENVPRYKAVGFYQHDIGMRKDLSVPIKPKE